MKLNKVNFITTTSDQLGSHRYRISTPAQMLSKTPGIFARVAPYPDGHEDVAVFSKHFNMLDYCYARFIHAQGGRVIFDVCDLHDDNETLWPHYQRMAKVADAVTFPTLTLMGEFATAIGEADNPTTPYLEVPDPILLPSQQPKIHKPTSNPNMLWYGQGPSLSPLHSILPQLPKGNLTVICDKFPPWLNEYQGHINPVEWQDHVLERYLAECDFVLLPQSLDRKASCKSPNRLIEALNAGCMAIASPIPAYEEFTAYALIGTNFADLIRQFLDADPVWVRERILAGQQYIMTKYSNTHVTAAWRTAIERSLE